MHPGLPALSSRDSPIVRHSGGPGFFVTRGHAFDSQRHVPWNRRAYLELGWPGPAALPDSSRRTLK